MSVNNSELKMIADPHVDLAFPVRGRAVPCDHAYALYGALSRVIPDIHGASWIGIHGISGRLLKSDVLTLGAMSVLRVRVPAAKILELLALTGVTLELSGHLVELGAPTVHELAPVSVLDARLVLIRLTGGIPKPFDQAEFERRFVAEARRQLAGHGVRGDLELSGRKSLRVGGQRLLGHAVRVLGLSTDDSLKLQICGLGGKRTMGCGLFRPARVGIELKQVA